MRNVAAVAVFNTIYWWFLIAAYFFSATLYIGSAGGDEGSCGWHHGRHRVPEHHRQDQEPRFRFHRVRESPSGGDGASKTVQRASSAVGSTDRRRLGGAGVGGRRRCYVHGTHRRQSAVNQSMPFLRHRWLFIVGARNSDYFLVHLSSNDRNVAGTEKFQSVLE